MYYVFLECSLALFALKKFFCFPSPSIFCPTPQRSPYRLFSPLQLIIFLPFFNLLNLTGIIYLSAILLKLHKVFLFSFWYFHSPAFSLGRLRFISHACVHLVWAPFLCYRINYYLSGGFYPVSFHVVNILLHGGISVLMVDVFSVLFGGLHYTSKGRRLNLAPRSALLAALLFAVHPVHTECVSIVCSQRLHSWKDEKLGMRQFVS